ncbi:MAG: ATP-binding protein [Alphaproteobacteria bacterium]|nr:ATP-binding protein [Alphaproteobacteria bacterium]
MLCSLNSKRPDKILNRRLLALAYTLIVLAISIAVLLVYPEHYSYAVIFVILVLCTCVYLSIKTISAAEEAISYGGFASEIIRNNSNIRRIDNAQGEPVIQNNIAEDFFKNENILNFIENNLSSDSNNKIEFNRLQSACQNLIKTKVTLSLSLNQNSDKIFENEEWFEIEVAPIFLKKTDIFEKPFSVEKIKNETYLLWSINNITAQRNMDTIFKEERNSLHDFLDYLPVGLYTCNSKYELEYCNHAFAKMLNTNREVLLTKNLQDLLMQSSKLPPKTTAWQGRLFFKNDDEAVDVYIAQENFREKGQIKIRTAVFKNLPDEQKIQNELNQVLNKLNWLFGASPIGILLISKSFNIMEANETAKAFFNLTSQNAENLNLFFSEEDFSRLQQEFTSESYPKKVDMPVKIGQVSKMVTFYVTKMQNLYASNSNKTEGWVIYSSDATEQKNLELQYAQAQKMQAMGQLAGGVAHDFNNLLTAMIGFCDLLLQRHGVGDPSFADLIQIKQNANRAAGLVRQLLAFSRKQPLKPKLLDVAESFLELKYMLNRTLGENINISFYHGENLGFIKVDPVQFSQVILNLAVNAKDAMEGKGELKINTRVEQILEPYKFGEDIINPAEFIVLEVSDSGCGISQENINRIFEPFFSTKENVVGSGTGLGLAMVYGIVRQTGGFIKVQSEIGKGTMFSIYLPRFEADEENLTQIEEAKEEKELSLSVGYNQKMILGLNVSNIDRSTEETFFDATKIRIIFVEDEDSVRTFAVRALKKKGYDVVGCNSAENALEHLENDANFHLMITDMVMPGMSGVELAGIVKEKIKDIKIILASGYSEEIAKKDLSNNDNFDFMAKPFSLGDLTKKVFDVINEA